MSKSCIWQKKNSQSFCSPARRRTVGSSRNLFFRHAGKERVTSPNTVCIGGYCHHCSSANISWCHINAGVSAVSSLFTRKNILTFVAKENHVHRLKKDRQQLLISSLTADTLLLHNRSQTGDAISIKISNNLRFKHRHTHLPIESNCILPLSSSVLWIHHRQISVAATP